MAQYYRGRAKEWDVRDVLIGWGYRVTRTAGSKGLWDIHAVMDGKHHLLIQVKYTKKPSGWRDANCILFEEFEPPPATYKEFWIYTYGVIEPEVIPIA
ncbi:hypothetical protein LCGC14_1448200 [marine sediment metagenome]|uniref:PD(D/E)XK endonuclease domain-containing protein n=1 Tax=marine sediment metagenome TaxID=412755 RepID=A0A0F9JJB0_9ZZZZ